MARELGRARRTVCDYLCDYIRHDHPASIAIWVDDNEYARVAEAAARLGPGPLKTLFAAHDEKVPYETIKAVLAHLTSDSDASGGA